MPGEEEKEKRRVTLVSIVGAIAITALKLAAGLTTGSLGIISEAAHSGLDFVAAVVTYVSVRIADKPADADHPFGHQKFENFSAFVETALLLITCVWILREAIKRLLYQHVEIEPSAWAFLVMFGSIAVDYSRSRALMRVARKYESQAIEADALHFSTDIWSSLVVIFGLTLVWAGRRYAVPELRVADPLAAMAVSGIVVFISLQLGKRTLDALLDAAPPGLQARLEARVRGVQEVLGIERLRVRRAGNRYFVDTIIAVERSLPLEQVDAIADNVQDQIRQVLPRVDVMIHTEPRAPVQSSLFETVKSVANRHKVLVHELAAHDIGGEKHLELHLEVSRTLTLRQAHELVTAVEADILREAPDVAAINTHIEDQEAEVQPGSLATDRYGHIERRLREIAAQFPELIDCHDIAVRDAGNRLYVSCHCTLNGDLPIGRVHQITREFESQFRSAAPNVHRLTIHSEPAAA
ncbi:MAG: cation-efflux pump [Acidobacteria bacterium]|jgi:cation diffusion facilitator family transporter|nr:cation-efflux pump [Acidobacteriota bacterium]